MRFSVEHDAADATPWAGSLKFRYALLLACPMMNRPHETLPLADGAIRPMTEPAITAIAMRASRRICGDED
jgi:hypothetical protein